MEQWKDAVGYSFYEISDAGNVRRKVGYQCVKARNRKSVLNPNGYFQVLLCEGSRKTIRYIHRMVAAAFIGPPEGKTVNHKNGIKTDNRLENLEYMTQRENNLHAYRVTKAKRGPLSEEILRNPINGRIIKILPRQTRPPLVPTP